jgi:hypothetical protein
VVNDRGKTYGIYAVSVAKCYETGYLEKWHVYRRYSDFHDLHQKVKDKVTMPCMMVVLSITVFDLVVLCIYIYIYIFIYL